MIDRRALFLALPLALAAAPVFAQAPAGPAIAASDDDALVAKAAAYLQGLTSVQGQFVQTSPRGAVSRGTVFIKRPGKARFAYDSGLLVVSDGSAVSLWDKRLKTFDKYPLSATPLSLFLARNIRLDKGVKVTRVARTQSGFAITLKDGKKQAEGQITLSFSDGPVALREWALTDAQGQTTRVSVAGLRSASLDNSLFALKDPRPNRNAGPGGGR